jgi:multidrug efflux pump subunit AcrA (membrane-fusion protein)
MKTALLSRIAQTFALALLVTACGKKTKETQVSRQDVETFVFASGILEPESQYNLTAQNDGYLTQLAIEEGDLVSPNQVLALIDNPQNSINAGSATRLLSIARQNADANAPALLQVEANIAAAAEKVKQDELQQGRFQRLYAANSVSKVEYENATLALSNSKANLEALRQQLATLRRQADQQVVVQNAQSEVSNVAAGNNTVRAILAGKVYRRFKQLGDYVRRGEVIAVIGDPNRLHARLGIDEDNVSKVRLGQDVTIRLNTLHDQPLRARISEIRPSFDETTQSFLVEAAFIDSLPFRISGTQLEANIAIAQLKQVLVIPRAYLGFKDMVRVKRGGDEVNQVIKPGFVSNEWIEVLDGLQQGETIISDAQ